MSEFSRLTEINLMEQFVDGVRGFAASTVNGFKTIKKRTSNKSGERWSLLSYKVLENVCILSVLYFQVPTC